MRIEIGLSLLAAFSWPGPPPDDAVQAARARLQGGWRLTTLIWGGEPAEPVKFAASREHWIICGDRLVIFEAGHRVRDARIEVDPARTPATLTMNGPSGARRSCIYRIDGDALTVCFRLGAKEAPKEFDSPARTLQKIAVFVRSADGPGPADRAAPPSFFGAMTYPSRAAAKRGEPRLDEPE